MSLPQTVAERWRTKAFLKNILRSQYSLPIFHSALFSAASPALDRSVPISGQKNPSSQWLDLI